MKRTYRFVEPVGFVTCTTTSGERVEIPVVPGIFKHPTIAELTKRLEDPVVAKKCTFEALCRAPWSAVRRFPRAWLLAHLAEADLTDGRRRALELMLDVDPGASGRGPRRDVPTDTT